MPFFSSVQPDSVLHALILSASLGALVGSIRQWMEQQAHPDGADGPSYPGIRTFTLWAVLGFISAYLSQSVPYFFTASFVMFALFLGGAYLVAGGALSGLGLTTHSAGLLTFIVGGLVGYRDLVLALVLTGLAMVILGARQRVHGWTRRLTDRDLSSALQFVAITGVILPLVPDKWYGPFEAFNPHETWLMVVLIAGLGFVGYVAMRLLGARAGVIVTGLVGGIASSTATTLALSRESRDNPGIGKPLALAVVLSCVVMCVRVLIMILVINRDVFVACLLPFAVMSVPGVAFLLWMVYGKKNDTGPEMNTPEISNPLSLKMAVKFGLIYAVVAFGVKALSQAHLDSGVYSVAFLSGLTDMAAISISSAQSVNDQNMVVQVATRAVVIGALSNTIVKGGIALWLGAGVYRKSVAWALGATLVAGAAILPFI